MSLFRSIDWDDVERSANSEPYVPVRRQSPSGRLAAGSFRCPQCDLPIALAAPVSLRAQLRCPYCRSLERVRDYVHVDAYDTPSNVVELRVKLPL